MPIADFHTNDPELWPQEEKPAISAVLADDDAVFRKLLSSFVDRLPQVHLLGAAVDGREALEMVAALRPSLLLMDLDMPGINGLQAMALVRKYYPATRVIIITSNESDEAIEACRAEGADGFVSKSGFQRDLPGAICEALSSQ